jgi:hypothetical protein
LVAFLADPPKHLIRGGSGQGLPGAKYPDTVFLSERPCPADRAERDLFAGGLHLQRVARFEMQLFPERLGDNDTARFINGEASVHNGTVLWVDPSIYPILSERDQKPVTQSLTLGKWRIRNVKKSLIVLMIGCLAGFAAWGQDTAKDDLKKSGQDVKKAGKDTGKAAKDAGKGVKKGTKKGVNKAAKATEKGADKVDDKTKQ